MKIKYCTLIAILMFSWTVTGLAAQEEEVINEEELFLEVPLGLYFNRAECEDFGTLTYGDVEYILPRVSSWEMQTLQSSIDQTLRICENCCFCLNIHPPAYHVLRVL